MEVSKLRKSPRRKNSSLQAIWQIFLLIPKGLKKLWRSIQSIWRQEKPTQRRTSKHKFFDLGSDRSSSFLLGLNNHKDLGNLSTSDFLQLIAWGSVNQVISTPEVFSPPDDLANNLSTEFLLQEIKWDVDPVASKAPATKSAEPSPPIDYLLGLEDIEDLESLLTQDLLQLIKWETSHPANLVAEEEDLHLLEDLLVDFPE